VLFSKRPMFCKMRVYIGIYMRTLVLNMSSKLGPLQQIALEDCINSDVMYTVPPFVTSESLSVALQLV
jgi:hypothetical protein